jgi:hypothetical protein
MHWLIGAGLIAVVVLFAARGRSTTPSQLTDQICADAKARLHPLYQAKIDQIGDQADNDPNFPVVQALHEVAYDIENDPGSAADRDDAETAVRCIDRLIFLIESGALEESS